MNKLVEKNLSRIEFREDRIPLKNKPKRMKGKREKGRDNMGLGTDESCETLKIRVRIDHESVVCDKRYYQAG